MKKANQLISPLKALVIIGALFHPIIVRAAPFVFYADGSNGRLDVVNTQTNTIVYTSPEVSESTSLPSYSGRNITGAAASPDGSRVYISEGALNKLAVLDATTFELKSEVPVGSLPAGVVISPNGRFVYVLNRLDNTISVVDPTLAISNPSQAQVGVIPVTVPSGNLIRLAISPDGSRLYVTQSGNQMTVINALTRTIMATVPVTSPGGIAASAMSIVVTNPPQNSLTVFNAATFAVTATIPFPNEGGSPTAIILSPDGNTAYVLSTLLGKIYVMDLAAQSLVTSIPYGSQLTGTLGASQDGRFIYFDRGVIDTTTNSIIASYVTRSDPIGNIAVQLQTPQPFTADTVPPAAVLDLAAGVPTRSSIDLSWSAPADPTSPVAAYSIRYATFPISAANFPYATAVPSPPAPAAPGVQQSYVVNGLNSSTTYFFAIKSADATGNLSALSNLASARTKRAPHVFYAASLDGRLDVVNTQTNTIVYTSPVVSESTSLPSYSGRQPNGAAASPDGSRVYISEGALNKLAVLDATTFELKSEVPVGSLPAGVVISPNGRFVYVLNRLDNTISVVDPTLAISNPSQAQVGVIPVTVPSGNLIRLAISPDGSRLYVTQSGNQMTVINALTRTIVATVPITSSAGGIAASATSIVATNPPQNSLTVFNAATFAVTVTIPFPNEGGSPANIVLSPDGKMAYVLSTLLGKIYVMDLAAQSFVTSIANGTQLTGTLAASQDGRFIYFDRGVIDTTTNSIIASYVTRSELIGNIAVQLQTSQPFTADTVPPAAVLDLAASVLTSSSIDLSWSAPADPTSPVAAYSIRYATFPISAVNFSHATAAPSPPAPAAPGVQQSYVVNGLNSSTTYFFAIKSADATGNLSAISNLASARTLSAPLVFYAGNDYLYVINTQANSVVYESLQLSASTSLPSYFGRNVTGAAASPDGSLVYMSEGALNKLAVLDATTFELKSEVPVGSLPRGVVISPNGRFVYVLNRIDNTISVVDPTLALSNPAQAQIGIIPIPGGAALRLAISPNGNRLYVTQSGNQMTVIDALTRKIAATVPVTSPSGIAVSNTSIVVANQSVGTLTVFDAATLTVTATIPMSGLSPANIALSPDGNTAYVVSPGFQRIYVVNLSAQSIVTFVSGQTGGLGVTQDGRYVYFDLGVIDTTTNQIVASFVAHSDSFIGGITVQRQTPQPFTADTVPPAAVTDLNASVLTSSSVDLNWTAPADPTSPVAAYDIRYATFPISGANFPYATAVASPPAPAAPGIQQSATITGLSSSNTYYFALRSFDATGNASTAEPASFATNSTTTVLGRPEVVFLSDQPGITATAVSTASPNISLALASATAQGLQLISNIFDITHGTFTPPATIIFRFDSGVVTDTSSLAIYRYDGVSWSSTSIAGITNQSVLDSGDSRVTANVAFTSLWALFVRRTDSLPPRTSFTPGSPAFGQVPLFLSSTTLISFAAADDKSIVGDGQGSGIAETRYAVDSGPFLVFNFPFSIVSEGTHTVHWFSRDLAGNIEGTQSTPIVVDVTPPLTQISVNGSYFSDQPNKFHFSSAALLGFSAADPASNGAASGVSRTFFSVDGSSLTPFTAAFSLSIGTHAVRFLSSDNLGNAEQPHDVSVVVDTMPPALSFTPATGSIITTTAPLIVLTYLDMDSGVSVSSVRLLLDGVDVTSGAVVAASSAVFTPSSLIAQGAHTASAEATDNVGNSATISSTFFVDSLAPQTALLINGQSTNGSNFVIVSTDSLGFTAADAGTGVVETRYSVDGSSEQAFGSAFSLSPGSHVLTFHSFDGAGNDEPLRSVTLNVLLFDTAAPQIEINPIDQSTATTASPLITVLYSDTGRGVDPSSIRLQLDGVNVTSQAAVTASSATFTPTLSQGAHVVAANISDLAGNVVSASISFFVDSLPPITALLINDLRASTTNLVALSTDTFGFSSVDNGTGALETLYRIDGSTTDLVFITAFSLPVGVHSLSFHGTDRAGNAEQTHTAQVTVLLADSAVPVLALTPPSGSTITSAAPSVVASYGDSGRGVDLASFRLTLDDLDVTAQASVTASSASFTPTTALSQGTHTVTASVSDLAGNAASASSTFLIDSLPPLTTLLVNGLAAGSTNLVLIATDALSFAAADTGAGVLETLYSVDGAIEAAFTAAFFLSPGSHALAFHSRDRAGNSEATKSASITVTGPSSDTTPPLVRLDYPGASGLGIEQAIGGVVNVHGAISDASAVNWTLETAPGASATGGFTTIASGAGNLSGLVAAWNTASLSGYQTLRLRAADSFGNAASATTTVFVGAPVISFAIGRKDSDAIVATLKGPTGIAVRSDGSVWVASTENDKILLISPAGVLLGEAGRAPGHSGEAKEHGKKDKDDDDEDDQGLGFKTPQGLALDAAGSLYVADRDLNRVVKLSPDGHTLLLQLGKRDGQGRPKSGSGPGELRHPFDVAVDGNGDIYVADSGNRRVQVFDASGAFLRQFGQSVLLSTSEIRGIALTAEGLWVSDKELEVIHLFSRSGSLIKTIGAADSVVGDISRTRGLASDRLGALYVVEPNRDRVQKFDPQGKGLLAFGNRDGLSQADKIAKRWLSQPLDAAVAPDGSIWVTDAGRDRVVRYALPAPGGYLGGGAVSSSSVEPARRVVDHKDGAKVQRDDGAGVRVPKGALSSDLEITVDKGDENQDKEQKDAKRRDMKITAVSQEVQYGPEGTTFNTPVTLTLPYDANAIAAMGISEDDLKIYYWNPTLKDWQAMPSTVDKQNKVVNAQTTHFSAYQVGGLGGIGVAAVDDFGLRDGYAFPNPSRKGSAVTFRMQPGSADSIEVRVYDLSGRKVHSSSDFRFRGAIDDGNGKGAQNTYDHVWDVSGIGSGVYSFVITAKKAGEADVRKTGKVGVIR